MGNWGERKPPASSQDAVQSDLWDEGADADFTSELPRKLARYGAARERATRILSHLEKVRNKPENGARAARAADLLKGCGEYLVFRDYHTVGQTRLTHASFCRQSIVCPLCAIRRSAKLVGAYVQKFEAVMQAEPALRPVFLTYTVKNGPDLTERMAHLRRSIATLTERRQKARKRGNGAGGTWGLIAGAVGAYEATYSPNKGWHPHMHMVALCDGWMAHSAMVDEWREITGDSFIVGISALNRAKPISDAFCEVFKYALKFADLQPATVWEAAEALRRQRMVFSLGNLRGVEIPESLLDEPLDGLPYVEHFFRYLGKGRYG